ncbi:MAG: hypothetical protein HKO92_09015, partial [Flavobacteriaceae bacterium]|nr:hypothetical protein [Flavobacteriaceae bacterium]
MKHFFVLIIIFTLFLSCQTKQQNITSASQLIPETSDVILKINDLETFRSDIKNNAFTASFKPLKFSNLLSKKNNILENLNTTNPLYICLENKNDSLQFTLITRLKDSLFTKDLDTTYFFTKTIDSIFIGSTSRTVLSKVEAKKNQPFSDSFKTTNSKKTFSILLPKKATDSLTNQLLGIKNNKFSNFLTLDSEVSHDKILFNGITSSIDTIPNLLDVFNQNIPQENSLQNIIPEDFESAISITFSNYETFNNKLKKALNKKKDSIVDFDIFETINEVGKISIDNQNIIALHSLDANATNEFLNLNRSKLNTFRDVDIFEFTNDSIFKNSFEPFFKLDSVIQYVNLDEFFVFAKQSEILEKIISSYKNGSVLSQSNQFKDAFSNLSDESSILVFTNNNSLKSKLSNLFNLDDLPSLKNYKLSAFQFIKDDTFSHFNAVIHKNKSLVSSNSISEEFSVKLDADIIMPPQFVKNHKTRQYDIVVQDVNNNLYLISNKGKVLWKKALHGNILGKIEQVDLYKNGRLQLA